jgi:threonine/homoserine/homoserine lactone efflux protein
MPDPHLLLPFVLAVTALILVPGPNMALIVANSLAYGARWGVLTVLATVSASMVQLLLVAFGMATVVSQIGDWVGVLRWVGVVYLLLIGIQQWRAPPPDLSSVRAQQRSVARIFRRAALVSVTNPKTLLFYAAFYPQFVVADRPIASQFLVLAAINLFIALTLDSLWAIIAGQVRRVIGRRAGLINRASGAVLITAGLGLALKRAQ